MSLLIKLSKGVGSVLDYFVQGFETIEDRIVRHRNYISRDVLKRVAKEFDLEMQGLEEALDASQSMLQSSSINLGLQREKITSLNYGIINLEKKLKKSEHSAETFTRKSIVQGYKLGILRGQLRLLEAIVATKEENEVATLVLDDRTRIVYVNESAAEALNLKVDLSTFSLLSNPVGFSEAVGQVEMMICANKVIKDIAQTRKYTDRQVSYLFQETDDKGKERFVRNIFDLESLEKNDFTVVNMYPKRSVEFKRGKHRLKGHVVYDDLSPVYFDLYLRHVENKKYFDEHGSFPEQAPILVKLSRAKSVSDNALDALNALGDQTANIKLVYSGPVRRLARVLKGKLWPDEEANPQPSM